MVVLRIGSKYSHTRCMLCFFTVSRLALNPNLIFEIGSKIRARFYSSIDFAGGCLIFFISKALPSTAKVVTE
jgi:hypothetical protein